jgi:hypothetical protein
VFVCSTCTRDDNGREEPNPPNPHRSAPLRKPQTCADIVIFARVAVEKIQTCWVRGGLGKGQYPPCPAPCPPLNPGWRNYPNFSWKQNQPTTNQGGAPHPPNYYPLGFSSSYQNHGRFTPPASSSSYQTPTQAPASST